MHACILHTCIVPCVYTYTHSYIHLRVSLNQWCLIASVMLSSPAVVVGHCLADPAGVLGVIGPPYDRGGGVEVLWLLFYAGLLIFGARPQSMLVGVVGEWAVWSVAGW